MRVIFLLSLGTIAACAPAQSSPGFIFPFWFISWVWSLSFLHLLLLFLLLLFLTALAYFIFSVTRSFSLPKFSVFPLGHVSPCSAWTVLRGGLAALCLVSQLWFGRAALFCVAWVCADASVIRSCSRGGLALPYPRPSPLNVQGVQERFISQSLTLLLVGRTGW